MHLLRYYCTFSGYGITFKGFFSVSGSGLWELLTRLLEVGVSESSGALRLTSVVTLVFAVMMELK